MVQDHKLVLWQTEAEVDLWAQKNKDCLKFLASEVHQRSKMTLYYFRTDQWRKINQITAILVE